MNTLLLFILLGVLLPQLGLPPKVAQVLAIALAVFALLLFVAWPGLRVKGG